MVGVARRLHVHRLPPTHLSLPALRLPVPIFPHQPVSLPVLERSLHERPLPGCLSPALARELRVDHEHPSCAHVALLAYGATVGVLAELPTESSAAAHGMLLHSVGGARVAIQETLHRSPAGARFARFVPHDDDMDATSSDEAARVEAYSAHEFLSRPGVWARDLWTMDADATILPLGADPRAQRHWHNHAHMPESPSDLAFWLAARLPLTRRLRLRLLESRSPLQRLQTLTDAMRLLAAKPSPSLKCSMKASALRTEQGGTAGGRALRIVWRAPLDPVFDGAAPLPRALVDDWLPGEDHHSGGVGEGAPIGRTRA